MDLDSLLDLWYQTDPSYFDEIFALTSSSISHEVWGQLTAALDDGDITDACDGIYTADQIAFLYDALKPICSP